MPATLSVLCYQQRSKCLNTVCVFFFFPLFSYVCLNTHQTHTSKSSLFNEHFCRQLKLFLFSTSLCVFCVHFLFFLSFYCLKFFFHFFCAHIFCHPHWPPCHLSSICVLSLTVQNQHWLCCTFAFPFDFSSHCVSQVQFAYLIWYHLLAGADVVAFLFSVLFICSVHTFHFVRWCDYICACVQQCWHQAMINRTSLNSYGRSSSSSNEGTVFWACVCEHYHFFFLFADHYITLLINIISGQQLQYNNGCC